MNRRRTLLLACVTLALLLNAQQKAAALTLYDPAAPASAALWQFYGAKAETVDGARRVTFGPEGVAYMLWNFPRDWSDRARLEVNVLAAQDMSVSVAVCDEWDTYALHTEAVKAGPARLVFPMPEIVRDGIQLCFMKKIAISARAKEPPAVLTLGRIELVGILGTGAMPRNWMTLCDGESPRSESVWEQFRSGRARAAEEHATRGKRSVRLTFQGEHWCSAYGFIQPDWRGYEKLVMEIFNPTEEELKLRISFRPTWTFYNGVEAVHVASLKRGVNHVVCDLAEAAAEAERESGRKFDFSVIQNFPFRMLENEKTVSVYVDDVHLEGPDATRPAPVPAFLTKSHESEWYERFGLTDTAFATEPLSAEELGGDKPVEVTDLSTVPQGRLLAGVAKISITPTASREGRGRPLLSNVYARAVVLSDGRTKAAFVVLDWLAAWGPVTDVSKEIAARLTDIPGKNIFVWATHNHSGPHAWGRIGTKGYKKDVSGWIASAVVRARQKMQPVRLRGAKGNFDLNFNRRYVFPDGTAGGFLWHRYLEKHWDHSFVDKEMGLVVLEDDRKRPVASLVMYSGHANMNCVINTTYNADYPGVACTTLERQTGAPVLFINGSFGNVDMKGNALSLERTVKTGLDVARAVHQLTTRLEPLKTTPVRCGYRSRQAAPWGGKPGRTIEAAALAFGDVAFAQSAGELYTEFSPEIKKGSPYPFTFTTYWRGGYLPTRKATMEGGYRTNRGPDWGELTRDLSIELLKQLHEQN